MLAFSGLKKKHIKSRYNHNDESGFFYLYPDSVLKFYIRSIALTSIIEKRQSLHRQLKRHRYENSGLKMQIGQLQALANIGTTTCMIAHEINNLLTPLSNYAQLAMNNPDDKELTAKVLQKTFKNCQRASMVMESILGVANGESRSKKECHLRGLVEEIFNCLCRDFSKDGIIVENKIPEDLTVWAVPVNIQQVMMNLILNGRDAIFPGNGTIAIEAKESGEFVEIIVRDTGVGIEPEHLERIFDPFFSTKSKQKDSGQPYGSGLGLAFCKKVVDEHEGTIGVESEPQVGTTFEINLPKNQ